MPHAEDCDELSNFVQGTQVSKHPLRDLALIRLLHDLGLRRAEAVALDLESIDLAGGTVEVVGKGKTDATRLTLPDPTRDALAAWLEGSHNHWNRNVR